MPTSFLIRCSRLSSQQTYALRAHIAQLRDKHFGLDRKAYFSPSHPDPKTLRGGLWIMDPSKDHEGPRYGKPIEREPSGFTSSGGAVWD